MNKKVPLSKISKSKMLQAMLNEFHSALENQNSSVLSGIWWELFDLDRDDFSMYNEYPLTTKIEGMDGLKRDMNRDEIDDLICDLSWEVIKDVEKCIKGSSGTLIIINDNEGE